MLFADSSMLHAVSSMLYAVSSNGVGFAGGVLIQNFPELSFSAGW